MAAPLGLAQISQDDFAAGMVRSVARHLIPPNGCYDLLNYLLADEDGSPFKRGGSEYKTNAAFGASLRFLWDGQLSVGQRTLFASPTSFGVLGPDDATPIDLGGGGLSAPAKAARLGDLLFIGGGTVYAGSRKAAGYSAGTLTGTQGSSSVTGTGTLWGANVDAGMLLRIGGSGRYYVVKSVDNDTALTLTEPLDAAATGATYALSAIATADAPYRSSAGYTVVGDKLITWQDNKVFPSENRDVNGLLQPHVFVGDDLHEFPGIVLGADALRDLLIVFTTAGVYAVSGLWFTLTDAAGNQQRQQQRISPDLILWGLEGVAAWGDRLVVPGADNVYLFDGAGAPQSISDSITPLYLSYLRAGYKPGGGVVYRSHYFLPILAADNSVVDQLVCRLDRPIQDPRGRLIWPWSHVDGHAGNVAQLAVRIGSGAVRQPELFAAGRGTDARVTKLSGLFDPDVPRKLDADGSAFTYRIDTRDFPTGNGNANLVRRLMALYELVDAASDDPQLSAFYGLPGVVSAAVTRWGEFNWGQADWSGGGGDETQFAALPGVAPPDRGLNPYVWLVDGVRGRHVRLRLESSDPAASMTLRRLTVFVLPSGKDI